MIRKPFNISLVALLLLAGLAVFQPAAKADVQVTLTVTGSRTGDATGGFYTSPYLFSINGGAGGTAISLACDDFNTDISFGYTWPANEFPISEVKLDGPQKFPIASDPILDFADLQPTTTAPTAAQVVDDYDAAAWLAVQLIDNKQSVIDETGAFITSAGAPVLSDPVLAGLYSYALWDIFDPGASDSRGLSQTAIDNILITAYDNRANLPSNLVIFTPDPQNVSDPKSVSQEFIGIMPEASSVAFLIFNLLALPGIILFVRRRRA